MTHRLIAFYLPQFHPIPENDAWWGKGFTEWTNVTKAAPQFRDHYQPHLPADLGFYDLRLAEAREQQAELARAHGIHGFCYYHYWFNGRRLLERPFHEVLESGRPDFPFCLCWANENWTRRWNGGERDILLGQAYCEEDDRRHLQALLPAFRDPRYLRVGDRPVFLVYRASHLPDPARTVATWRAEAQAGGLPGLYLCNVEAMAPEHGITVAGGFDAAVEFAPDWTCIPSPRVPGWGWRIGLRLGVANSNPYADHSVMDYVALRDRMLAKAVTPYLRYPGVTPCWDNTARRKAGAMIFHGSTPELYRDWLQQVLTRFQPPSPDENLVFVNAWNEWAEGNHLEPDQRWGRAYLEATRDALHASSPPPAPS